MSTSKAWGGRGIGICGPLKTLRGSVLAGATAMCLARSAAADPQSLTGAYSPYEQQAIGEAERELGARVDLAPEGKLIESIEFIRLDPIDHHDPLPAAIDVVHTTSRPYVLRSRT